MINVECVSCKAPYELDPRRVPDNGMKMRCPKCGTSFTVTKQGGVSPAPAPGAGAAAVMAPPAASGAVSKQTLFGQAAPVSSGSPPNPPAPIQPPTAPAKSKHATAFGVAPPSADPAPFNAAPIAAPIAPPIAPKPAAPPPSGVGGSAAAPQSVPPPVAAAVRPGAAKGAFGATMLGVRAPAPQLVPPAKADADLPALRVDAEEKWELEMPADLPAPKQSQDTFDLSVSRMFVDALPAPVGEVDLPAPRAPAAAKPVAEAGLGLKAVSASNAAAFGDLDLPAAKPTAKTTWGQAPKAGFGDLDLPTAKYSAADLPAPKFGADLPAVKSGADLPAPKFSADLPAFKGGTDLPVPKLAADLPALKSGADLPAPKFGADLPALSGGTDLPVHKGDLNLPGKKSTAASFGDLDLPAPKSEFGFGDLQLPSSHSQLAPPGSRAPGNESSFADLDLGAGDHHSGLSEPPDAGDGFGDIELPPPRAAAGLVPPKARTVQGVPTRQPANDDESSFGGLELDDDEGDSELPPSLLGDDESSFGGLEIEDEPVAKRAVAKAPVRTRSEPSDAGEEIEEFEPDQDLGGDEIEETDEGFNEFGEEEDEDGEEQEGDDEEMEFGISGEEGARGVPDAGDAARRQRGEEFEAKQAARGQRAIAAIVRLAVGLVLLVSGAAALKFTEYGVFGIYYWEKWLPEAGDAQFARSAIEKAENLATSDTYRDVRRALTELGSARAKTGINRALLSRSLLHESLYIVRFGEEASSAAHAAALVKRLEERSWNAPGADLARAADAARRRQWAEASRFLVQAHADKIDPYVELLEGEVALATGKLGDADKAFAKALQLGAGARARWGIARVALQRSDVEAQTTSVDETLKESPMHAEARVAEAHILWNQGKDERALHLLRVALGLDPTEDGRFLWSAKQSIAGGYSLLGYVHESRSRLHLARAAYEQALSADPYRVEALLGAGRVLLREKRYNDGLARFESALKVATKGGANPTVLSGRKADAEAQLGIGRALSALHRDPEAKLKLEALTASLPSDAEVILALGETEHAMGHFETAEANFRKSIELAPRRFDGYLALAQLFFKKGDAAKASEILNDAATHVEESSEMRRMLGQSEMARNRLESAVHEFKRALELDPQDVEAMFGMATALRRFGDLQGAEKILEKLSQRDAAYAGLAEQRGLLFEARGEFGKATQAYLDALEKDPGNSSLTLRLGGAQVEDGAFDAAEQTLSKVIRDMPNSAEAEYFIGRVAFGRGRTPDALTHFDRAVSLDGTKGEYHLYVGRAALEMGNLGRTLEEVLAAIHFTPELGDAYWIRAIVRLRMGAVKDALTDLAKALKLKPARTEAYAVMGDCHEQLRQLPDAIADYRTAVTRDPKRGEWWYRLAMLQGDSGNRSESGVSATKAIELGDTVDPMPYWLPDAYRISGEVAEAKNDRTSAIRMYKRYIAIAASTAIDRATIERKLESWGVRIEAEE